MVPLLTQVLATTGITLEEAVAQGHLLLIDSTAVPTGNRPGAGRQVERASYSGKHHLQPLNPGRCHHRRDPGGRLKTRYQDHATTAPPWETCGWAKVLEGADWVADTAYTTRGALTPTGKNPYRERLEWEKDLDRAVAPRARTH